MVSYVGLWVCGVCGFVGFTWKRVLCAGGGPSELEPPPPLCPSTTPAGERVFFIDLEPGQQLTIRHDASFASVGMLSW